MKKCVLVWILCVALFICTVPTVLVADASEIEGDWTTYRFADEYPDPNDPYDPLDPAEPYYRPAAGYRYTEEGFSVIPADYQLTTPRLSVMSKEQQAVKEGIYLEFRVDDFSYDGGLDADEWIAVTLTTEPKVSPGSTKYGGGWLELIRGKGNGECTGLTHLTEPATESSPGRFTYAGMHELSVPRDEQGREIYTLEITWNGSAYEMKLNGDAVPGGEEATALLEMLDPNGEFYVGIQMQSAVKNGTAGLTILRYGTSEAHATTPVGSDTRDPEDYCAYPPTTSTPLEVPKNQPAILWSPIATSYITTLGSRYTVLEDQTWRITATDPNMCVSFASGRNQYVLAEDFPVVGILVRNIWVNGGNLWYAAGEVLGTQNDCQLPFSIYDGESWEDAEGVEYFFIPVDLTGMWSGRIQTLSLELQVSDSESHEFDICYAGVFRSVDEARVYAYEYLLDSNCVGVAPAESVTSAETEPHYGSTDDPQRPATSETDRETEVVEDTTGSASQDVMELYGCSATLSINTVLVILLGAALFRKRKE